ncbi:hypothetical protein FVEN_g11801 [Fusarium venenatum]|uniref:Uncharacterized protein n=1 Tax=Fusarium venenatum TaxID=56646 RepID=A0A2L2U079_9HYPO|nr:uncharacterized protein FVRRES_08327 [Fusarium venenatum]KAG8349968.1 hypothetical protein FVEN_g11801 [Fusarium venenatum]KAH6965111.1 hypothetical protein EDB82DRAFT_289710 [Fusarium venenatum]CEI68250.1 unnamed protein product [Fusarium venenatum]
MASIIEKIKETVVPSNNEGYNTNTNTNSNEPPSYNESTHPNSNANSGLYNSVTENNTQQREFSSGASAPLESTSTQNEGVRTGDRINSLVENVPGVPSSSTQKQSTFDTPSYQNDMHHDTSSQTPIDAARAPPSALKKHLGEPKIEHDYPHESSTKRHSSVSHQEEHYNLN